MIEEAQGPINFTMLLTLFGDRLNGKFQIKHLNFKLYVHEPILLLKKKNKTLKNLLLILEILKFKTTKELTKRV